MKKGSKPGARRVTRATRSREKQSISGQRQQREKEGAGAETGAGVSNIPISQISHKKSGISDVLADETDSFHERALPEVLDKLSASL